MFGEIVDNLGAKYKVSRKAMQRFEEIYPTLFRVGRMGPKKKYCVEFFNN